MVRQNMPIHVHNGHYRSSRKIIHLFTAVDCMESASTVPKTATTYCRRYKNTPYAPCPVEDHAAFRTCKDCEKLAHTRQLAEQEEQEFGASDEELANILRAQEGE